MGQTNSATPCSTASATPVPFTITVEPTPVLSSTLAPPAICNATIFSYTATSATANVDFAWTRAADPDINANAPGAGTGNVSETLTNSSANTVTVMYTYTSTLQSPPYVNACDNSLAPDFVFVDVLPTPQVDDPADITVCAATAWMVDLTGNVNMPPTGVKWSATNS